MLVYFLSLCLNHFFLNYFQDWCSSVPFFSRYRGTWTQISFRVIEHVQIFYRINDAYRLSSFQKRIINTHTHWGNNKFNTIDFIASIVSIRLIDPFKQSKIMYILYIIYSLTVRFLFILFQSNNVFFQFCMKYGFGSDIIQVSLKNKSWHLLVRLVITIWRLHRRLQFANVYMQWNFTNLPYLWDFTTFPIIASINIDE